MRLAFAIEKLEPIWPHIMALAEAHWHETEGYRHGQAFQPDQARYLQYEAVDYYVMFTARHEGALVGYAGMYMTPSMHTQELIATEDTWFLLPEHRRGRNALEFYKFVEAECLKRGVREIGMTAKLTNGAGRILEYLGYREVSRQFSKHLIIQPSPQQETALTAGRPDRPMSENMEPDNVRTEPATAT